MTLAVTDEDAAATAAEQVVEHHSLGSGDNTLGANEGGVASVDSSCRQLIFAQPTSPITDQVSQCAAPLLGTSSAENTPSKPILRTASGQSDPEESKAATSGSGTEKQSVCEKLNGVAEQSELVKNNTLPSPVQNKTETTLKTQKIQLQSADSRLPVASNAVCSSDRSHAVADSASSMRAMDPNQQDCITEREISSVMSNKQPVVCQGTAKVIVANGTQSHRSSRPDGSDEKTLNVLSESNEDSIGILNGGNSTRCLSDANCAAATRANESNSTSESSPVAENEGPSVRSAAVTVFAPDMASSIPADQAPRSLVRDGSTVSSEQAGAKDSSINMSTVSSPASTLASCAASCANAGTSSSQSLAANKQSVQSVASSSQVAEATTAPPTKSDKNAKLLPAPSQAVMTCNSQRTVASSNGCLGAKTSTVGSPCGPAFAPGSTSSVLPGQVQTGALCHNPVVGQKIPQAFLPASRCTHPACCKQRLGSVSRGPPGSLTSPSKTGPASVYRSATAIAPNPHSSVNHRHMLPRPPIGAPHGRILASSLPPCCQAALPPCCLKAGIAPAQLAPRPRCGAPVMHSPAKAAPGAVNAPMMSTPTKPAFAKSSHVSSPTAADKHGLSPGMPPSISSAAQSASPAQPCMPRTVFGDGEHVTIWNRVERRKIAGNAAPLGKNLYKYLEQHKDCEIYHSQDLDMSGNRTNKKRPSVDSEIAAGDHVAIWNKRERRKIAGNAAPLMKNLVSYLAKRPDCEPYKDQDVELKKEAQQRKQKCRESDSDDHSAQDESSATHDVSITEEVKKEDLFDRSMHGEPPSHGSNSQSREEAYHGMACDDDLLRKTNSEASDPTEDSLEGLDAWRALDSEFYPSKTDLEQAAEFFLQMPLPKDDDDKVSLAVLTGPDDLSMPGMNIDQLGNLDIKTVLEVDDEFVNGVLEDIDKVDSASEEISEKPLPSLSDPLSGF